MQLTHFAPATNMLWKYIESCGHDPAPLYRKAGINPALLKKSNARISIAHVDELWRLAAELLDDPCFGVKMAENWHPSYVGALGYAWCASSTLKTAFNRVVRYIHVVSEDLNIKLANTPAGLKVIIDLEKSVFTLPQHHDVVLSVLMHMCRFNYGDELMPSEVCLAHAQPPCEKTISAYFRIPVVYNAPVSSITLSKYDVEKTLGSGNKELVLLHDEFLMKYLIEIKKGDIVRQIQSVIIENLPSGNVTDNLIARELNLSERSLQRKLKERGTSFRALLDNVRKMAAIQYIKNPVNSMSDIAFLLGFSEQSAFSRAFKKWTGTSPIKYRNSLK
ncbi:MAG: AraC family transcriptional regulator ligand-binding domain-containing protein [Gammaproteobacteria bacterium]|jgi:AraC-like DNA-binding protein